MQSELEKILQRYSYAYPKELVAQKPASPRDSARLLVYNRKSKKIFETTFKQLADYVPKDAVIVFNRTKVIPARLAVKKPTGGKVELLYLRPQGRNVVALANKKLVAGTELTLSKKYKFSVVKAAKGEYVIRPLFSSSSVLAVLQKYGHIPLPPYLRNSPLSEARRRKEYQTVFAKELGAVAAPTASLHFTERLLGRLARKGVRSAFVTLHVGLGTFAPLTQEAVQKKKLHLEHFEIDKRTMKLLNKAKQEGRPIIAVGTTVVRTLESAADDKGILRRLSGATDLFIQENTKLKFTDSIVTNFHVPSSSLLMLVSAFVGRLTLLRLYKYAIKRKFKLFSFGDGMFIVPV